MASEAVWGQGYWVDGRASVLDQLKLIEGFFETVGKEAVAIIQTRHDWAVNEDGSDMGGEGGMETFGATEVIGRQIRWCC